MQLRRKSSKLLIATVLSTTQVAVYAPIFHPFFRLPTNHITITVHAHDVRRDVATGTLILAAATGH